LLGLRAIYQPGFKLAKAGVMLMELTPASQQQFELCLEEPEAGRDKARLMQALDSVNDRWGRGSIKVGSATIGRVPRAWSMKQQRRTPAYTTEWDDMPIARS
jgi:DNA polymerase V